MYGLLTFIIWCLRCINVLLIVYTVLRLMLPTWNSFMQAIEPVMSAVLEPVRKLSRKVFPMDMPFDASPVVLVCCLVIVNLLLQLIRCIFR